MWDILVLSGDSNDIEILSSYILKESLGSVLNEDKQLYYFNVGKRKLIENILNQYVEKFNVNFNWEVEDAQNWHLNWKDNFNWNRKECIDWDENFCDP